jgi:extracellular factor (EF) 3-hydroxypalmitic acid methyl ester biosynthesis protein
MQSWPRGYPGDYETIEYLCECESKARPGTVEYFIDQYGVTCNMAQQHRNKLTWQAAKVLQTSLGSAEESHVLSIACGGSRDLRSIQSLLQAAPVQLFLNDIDADALAHSENTLPHVAGKLHPIHANVFSAVRTFKKRGPFDLIVTGGLFDYLSDKQIKWLLEKLFESLRTQGRLCFTNIARGNPYRVWMEYLGDWKLLERSEADISTLIRETDLETSTQLDISRDQTGLTHLIELTRIV